MGKHDPRVRYNPVNGAALRSAIYAVPTRPLLDRPAELERVEGSAVGQRTCNVSLEVVKSIADLC